jgi:hypothetical protein
VTEQTAIRPPRREGCTALPLRKLSERPTGTDQHMPFLDHRTQQEVREDEVRAAILKELGR